MSLRRNGLRKQVIQAEKGGGALGLKRKRESRKVCLRKGEGKGTGLLYRASWVLPFEGFYLEV